MRAALFALALLTAGCRVGPDYVRPDPAGSAGLAWRDTGARGLDAAKGPETADLARWWTRLGSDELDALALRLVRQNLPLEQARQRVLAAQAQRAIVGSERAPQLNAEAAAMRAGTGDESLNFAGPPQGKTVDVYAIGGSGGWELDLWGRVGRLREAADASVEARVEDVRAATVAMLARLALAYVDATAQRARLDALARSVALEDQAVELARTLVDAGTAPRFDLDRAELEAARARSRLPDAERALRAAENRIAVLVGELPSDELVAATDALVLPPIPARGVPADLLVRRADVRAAERRLAAAVAEIGAAEGERYPRLSIGGTVALRATEPGTLTDADALSWSFGPELVLPILDGGRREARVALREVGAEEARLAFEHAMLEAAEEVENAGEACARARQTLDRLDTAAQAARAAVAHAEELRASGMQGLAPVLAARRAEVALEVERIQARATALAATIDLYRALGGGWEALEDQVAGAAGREPR